VVAITKLKRLTLAGLSVLVMATTAGGLLASAASAGSSKSVRVGDNYFVRPGGATVSVRRGTIVTWHWAGLAAHNVTVRRGPVRFRSKTQTRGTYSRRLTKASVYTIYCTIHGPAMSFKLRVR